MSLSAFAPAHPVRDELLSEYDSNKELPAFASWTLVSSDSEFEKHISKVPDRDLSRLVFRLEAFGQEFVGVNKSFRVVAGLVTFSYRVESSKSKGLNICFYAIPMQEPGTGRTGLIEVGSQTQDDPKNSFSLYRARFVVPRKHYGDDKWHTAELKFDFREIPEAFYCIFGARINEGSVDPAAGVMLLGHVRLSFLQTRSTDMPIEKKAREKPLRPNSHGGDHSPADTKPSTKTIHLPADARDNYKINGPVQRDDHNSRPLQGVTWWTMMEGPHSPFSIVVCYTKHGVEVEALSYNVNDLSFKLDEKSVYVITVTVTR